MVLSTCTPLFAGQAPWCPPPSACGGCSRGSTWTGQTWSVVDDIFIVLLRVITWRAPQAGQCRSSSQTWTAIFTNLKTILLYLLLMAASKCHGILVAPRTRIPSVSLPTPWNNWYTSPKYLFHTKIRVLAITCICTRNSVLILRADSDSLSERDPHNESTWTARESMKKTNKQKSGSINELITSSMKMMLGLCSRAISKRFFTNFSDSPNHLLTKSLLDTEKKVELLASVATAFAR